MKLTHKIASIVALVLSIGFVHCGSDGSNTPLGFGNTGTLSGFYAVSSSPAHNSFYISTSTRTVTIRMSEAVSQSSIPNNVQLIRNPNNAEQNVTANYNISAAGEVITLQGTQDLAASSDYEIRISPGLAAVSGNTFLQGQSYSVFYISFSTGSGGSNGQGQPGPPKVNSFGRQPDCSVLVTFNESLAYTPLIEFHSWNFGQVIMPAIVYPANSGNNSQWLAVMPSGYQPLAFDVKVTDYVDLEGNHGEPKLSNNMQCVF